MYDSIIFDLDGTLWDASDACAKGWNKALRAGQLTDVFVSPDDIRRVSGLPFEECVSTLIDDLSKQDLLALGREIDQEEKREVTLAGGEMYKGVKKGIPELSKQYPLFLVSNCQAWYLDAFWDIHGLKPHFKSHDCHGSSEVLKSEMISRVCRENRLTRPIYIGDTKGDQMASHEAGVAFGFATYGFGSTEEADHLFSSFEGLVSWFRETECIA